MIFLLRTKFSYVIIITSQSKRFPAEGWKQAMRDCLQTDLDIKLGKAAEETAVELLIMKYASK